MAKWLKIINLVVDSLFALVFLPPPFLLIVTLVNQFNVDSGEMFFGFFTPISVLSFFS